MNSCINHVRGGVSLELLVSVRIACWHLKQVSPTWDHSDGSLSQLLGRQSSTGFQSFCLVSLIMDCGQSPDRGTAAAEGRVLALRNLVGVDRGCPAQSTEEVLRSVHSCQPRNTHSVSPHFLFCLQVPKGQMWAEM